MYWLNIFNLFMFITLAGLNFGLNKYFQTIKQQADDCINMTENAKKYISLFSGVTMGFFVLCCIAIFLTLLAMVNIIHPPVV